MAVPIFRSPFFRQLHGASARKRGVLLPIIWMALTGVLLPTFQSVNGTNMWFSSLASTNVANDMCIARTWDSLANGNVITLYTQTWRMDASSRTWPWGTLANRHKFPYAKFRTAPGRSLTPRIKYSRTHHLAEQCQWPVHAPAALLKIWVLFIPSVIAIGPVWNCTSAATGIISSRSNGLQLCQAHV